MGYGTVQVPGREKDLLEQMSIVETITRVDRSVQCDVIQPMTFSLRAENPYCAPVEGESSGGTARPRKRESPIVVVPRPTGNNSRQKSPRKQVEVDQENAKSLTTARRDPWSVRETTPQGASTRSED